MNSIIGESSYTITVYQNGIKYRYIYILESIVDKNFEYDKTKYKARSRCGDKIGLFRFDRIEKTIYDPSKLSTRKSGRPVGSKDSYKRTVKPRNK